MPYIKPELRNPIDHRSHFPENAGELNYMITLIIKEYIDVHGLCYENLNAVVGALECCKLEFTRRVINSYEDSKIEKNGDVY